MFLDRNIKANLRIQIAYDIDASLKQSLMKIVYHGVYTVYKKYVYYFHVDVITPMLLQGTRAIYSGFVHPAYRITFKG